MWILGSPTNAYDLAEAIVKAIPQIKEGEKEVFHFTNEGACSWYDFAKAIFDLRGIATCHLLPLHTDEFPTPATRPHYSVLDKTKIKQTYGVEIPYWFDSLRECMEVIS